MHSWPIKMMYKMQDYENWIDAFNQLDSEPCLYPIYYNRSVKKSG